MPSLFDGIDDVIDSRLGLADAVGKPPRFENKANLIRILSHLPMPALMGALYEELIDVMTRRWEAAGSPPGSEHNWRFVPIPAIDLARNLSNETTLEKAIPKVSPDRWANQVPVVAGLVAGVGDNKRAIDLVERRDDGVYDFIELKVTSKETPTRAAFEIIKYGLAWVLCRRNRQQLACATQPLMAIDGTRLVALADEPFFFNGATPYPLDDLEAVIQEALRMAVPDFDLEFAFERFTGDFRWSAIDPLSDDVLRRELDRRKRVCRN